MANRTAKLHEVLAAEKTVLAQAAKLLAETVAKLGKDHFFAGHDKSLTLLADSSVKAATEAAARDIKLLPTNVPDTLKYFFDSWTRAEDLLMRKNATNQNARADIEIDGVVLAEDVPVDELLGLEARLLEIRKVIDAVPTLDASKKWVKAADLGTNIYRTESPEIVVKTEKITEAVVLYPATDKFPANIKEISKDNVVGSFSLTRTSGAITSAEKAEMMANVDTLIREVKMARTRANNIDIQEVNIGAVLAGFILSPIQG